MDDAATIIKRDHKQVKKDFTAFTRAKDKSEKSAIALQILDALEAHAKMEEEIFYPAVAAEGTPEAQDFIVESQEEHDEIKHLVMRFRDPIIEEREGLVMRMEELMAGVLHHAEEEEKELLPLVKKTLGKDRMRELGEQMEPLSATSQMGDNV